jgi:alanine dehydrogenase
MPAKPYIFYTKYGGDLRVMTSYLERLEISAVKLVNVHPNNQKNHKLPTVMATITVVDPKNGAPLAIMGGTTITNLRTGAAGGIAAKYLARKNSRVIGMVGAGAQARSQLLALKEIFPKIEEVKVSDKIKASRDRYVKEMTEKLGLNIRGVDSDRDAVEGADIVVTVTPARAPIIKSEWIDLGVHINAIGADAPRKEELDPKILKRAKIVVDDWEQASHGGEINVPLTKRIITKEDIWADLGQVVTGLKEGRASPDELTIFDSTGLAIQDAVTADYVYKHAVANGIGENIEIL